jgi:DNA protecting protein DprA
MRLVHPPQNILTLHFRALGEGSASSWHPPEVLGDDPPLPPPPGLICEHVPGELFVRGRPHAFELLRWLPELGFAVVGTRKPQPRSLHLVRARMRALEGTRLIILSGLALGVDAAAHEAALSSGLPTIAILGSPLDNIYPAENRGLVDRIIEGGGLIVSEFAPGTAIQPHFFLLRNRLIAGWSKATWVVEASHRSGALNTAEWALDHNRDTYATPCFPDDPALAGNQRLIKRDKAHPFWEPRDLAETWKEFETLGKRQTRGPATSLWSASRIPEPHHYNDNDSLSDAQRLAFHVAAITRQQGGAPVESLLDWALALGWDPQRFFDALRRSLDEQRIEDHGGLLCSAGSSGEPR